MCGGGSLTDALPGHAFTAVRMKEQGCVDGQRGLNCSRAAVIKQKVQMIPLLLWPTIVCGCIRLLHTKNSQTVNYLNNHANVNEVELLYQQAITKYSLTISLIRIRIRIRILLMAKYIYIYRKLSWWLVHRT